MEPDDQYSFNLQFLKNREPKADNERYADLSLDEKLKAQAPGILAWLVEGCLLWQKNGLDIPVKVQREGEEYRLGEDDMGEFVNYCCFTGSETEFESGATELYDVFFAWWKRYVGNWPPKQKRFGAYMHSRFECIKTGGVWRYFGVAINEDILEELNIEH